MEGQEQPCSSGEIPEHREGHAEAERRASSPPPTDVDLRKSWAGNRQFLVQHRDRTGGSISIQTKREVQQKPEGENYSHVVGGRKKFTSLRGAQRSAGGASSQLETEQSRSFRRRAEPKRVRGCTARGTIPAGRPGGPRAAGGSGSGEAKGEGKRWQPGGLRDPRTAGWMACGGFLKPGARKAKETGGRTRRGRLAPSALVPAEGLTACLPFCL